MEDLPQKELWKKSFQNPHNGFFRLFLEIILKNTEITISLMENLQIIEGKNVNSKHLVNLMIPSFLTKKGIRAPLPSTASSLSLNQLHIWWKYARKIKIQRR